LAKTGRLHSEPVAERNLGCWLAFS